MRTSQGYLEKKMKDEIYNKLRKVLNEANGYQKDFVNILFSKMCQKINGCCVKCNEHYEDGPTYTNIAGCFVKWYDSQQADDFLDHIIDMVDSRRNQNESKQI